MLLMIDNYDSFTWNLVQYLGELGQRATVVRNDAVSADEVGRMAPAAIVLSPGPRTPNDAGICLALVERYGLSHPMLGVCLGHQGICQALGARIVYAKTLMHGKVSLIHHDGSGVYAGLANPFAATRYHSLAVARESVPDCLVVNAWSEDGEVMGVRHREHPLHGVQFHPESIATEDGHRVLANFLRCAGCEPSAPADGATTATATKS